MAINRRAAFQDLVPLRDVMTRLFDDSAVLPSGVLGRSTPIALDVYTEADNYVLEVALPGLSPDSVDVSVLGNQVTISGEYAAATEGRRYLFRERASGRFERTVTLPTDIDAGKVEAHYEHGLLRLTLPKVESAKPRRIALAAAG